MPGVDFWRAFAILVAALGQLGFVLLYLSFPWWASFLGRSLFFMAASFALLLVVASAGIVWNWKGEDDTIVSLYCLVAVGIWYQLLAFLRVRLHKGNNDLQEKP